MSDIRSDDEGEHATEFTGGYLRCSCGWIDRRLYFSYDAVEAAAQTHLRVIGRADRREGSGA